MITANLDEFPMPDVIPATDDGGNQFTIENGMVLQGCPGDKPGETAFAWPAEDIRRFERDFFTENAHFLFENRERIFADIRMFLAPVNIMSGAAYIGPLVKPTVGTYIEWWLRRGEDNLAFFVSGSPLSGANMSKSIAKNDSLVPLLSPGTFLGLVKEFNNAHNRYINERKRFEAYPLFEVVMRLKGIPRRYEDDFRAWQHESRAESK